MGTPAGGYMVAMVALMEFAVIFSLLIARVAMARVLLEMGMTAARHIRAFREVGWFMLGFGTLMPVVNGIIGVTLAQLIGLDVGGSFVFGALCASASFIDAPAACRASLPEANPGIYLTSSLGITLPFNLLLGLPLYYSYALWLHRVI